MACWITKAAISLKRVKIEEKLLWRAYRKSPTLFRTVPFATPYGLPFPKIGVQNRTPKLQSLLSQERLKLWTANLADTFTRPSQHKPVKNFGEKGAWVYPGNARFFSVPPIISGSGKATNFKLSRYIQMVHANKSRLKIWEKMERGRIQGLPKFFEYPLLSRERIKLRTSNLARIFIGSIRTKAL